MRKSGNSEQKVEDERIVQQEDLSRAVVRLNVAITGVVFGVLFGLGLFGATLWLVIKGGPNVGMHLGLLRQFFPGYAVTYAGSIIGFIYGFLAGFLTGALIGAVYNKLAK